MRAAMTLLLGLASLATVLAGHVVIGGEGGSLVLTGDGSDTVRLSHNGTTTLGVHSDVSVYGELYLQDNQPVTSTINALLQANITLSAESMSISERLRIVVVNTTSAMARVAAAEVYLGDIDSRLEVTAASLSTVDARINTTLASVDERLSTAEANTTALEQRVAALEAEAASLNARVTALEGATGGSIAAPVISYSQTAISADYSVSFSSDVVSTGGPVVFYEVSPALPTGAALNRGTGKITGLVSSPQSAQAYTITAYGVGAQATVAVTIEITGTPPCGGYADTNGACWFASGVNESCNSRCSTEGLAFDAGAYTTMDNNFCYTVYAGLGKPDGQGNLSGGSATGVSGTMGPTGGSCHAINPTTLNLKGGAATGDATLNGMRMCACA